MTVTPRSPVFADLSGRRRRRMRRIGLAASATLLACLAVMGVGLLGGPGASVIPWGTRRAAASPGAPGPAGHTQAPRARPVAVGAPGSPPAAQAAPGAGPAPSVASSGSASPAASRSPAAVTNRAGKTPPGQNRTPRPSPSRTAHAG